VASCARVRDGFGGTEAALSKRCLLRPLTESSGRPRSNATATGGGSGAWGGRGGSFGASHGRGTTRESDASATGGVVGGGGDGDDGLMFDAPVDRKTGRPLAFGDEWGFACGHLWSGHVGYWCGTNTTNHQRAIILAPQRW